MKTKYLFSFILILGFSNPIFSQDEDPCEKSYELLTKSFNILYKDLEDQEKKMKIEEWETKYIEAKSKIVDYMRNWKGKCSSFAELKQDSIIFFLSSTLIIYHEPNEILFMGQFSQATQYIESVTAQIENLKKKGILGEKINNKLRDELGITSSFMTTIKTRLTTRKKAMDEKFLYTSKEMIKDKLFLPIRDTVIRHDTVFLETIKKPIIKIVPSVPTLQENIIPFNESNYNMVLDKIRYTPDFFYNKTPLFFEVNIPCNSTFNDILKVYESSGCNKEELSLIYRELKEFNAYLWNGDRTIINKLKPNDIIPCNLPGKKLMILNAEGMDLERIEDYELCNKKEMLDDIYTDDYTLYHKQKIKLSAK